MLSRVPPIASAAVLELSLVGAGPWAEHLVGRGTGSGAPFNALDPSGPPWTAATTWYAIEAATREHSKARHRGFRPTVPVGALRGRVRYRRQRLVCS
jgi:hypothetical protein